MPTGPKGEKRPVSSTSNAVEIMKIATKQKPEEFVKPKPKKKAGSTGDPNARPDSN